MGTETNICNIGADPEIMVTVCCLCYNHQSSVRQMLESVLYQDTKFLYEVIIHDDASTDATREIIEHVPRSNVQSKDYLPEGESV